MREGHIPAAHYIYQRVHTLAGRALHLTGHLDIAARAFDHIYGIRPELDERAIASKIAECLHDNRYPAHGSATVMLQFVPHENAPAYELLISCERPLLDRGYALSSLRPKAITYEYSIPYSAFPTGFQLSAAALYDTLALRHGGGATRSVRLCEPHGQTGGRLISCGDAPLFAIKGKTIFTASLLEGAMDSVERQLVMEAARKARINLIEEAPLHPELRDLDELFYADAAGITSLSECDGAKFMSLLAARIIANL